jgi:hypothetical protein
MNEDGDETSNNDKSYKEKWSYSFKYSEKGALKVH